MEIITLDQLLKYCKDKDRICPQPQLWNEMWNKLKDKKQIALGWQPPLPLYLQHGGKHLQLLNSKD